MLRSNYLFGLIGTALLLVIFGSRGLSQQSLQQWIPVEQAGINSHSDRERPWCPNGSFITQIDLDQQSGISAYDNPVIGQVRCGRLAGAESNRWASDPWWVPVEQAGINSHSSGGAPWCPNGSFIVQIDLDQQHGVSALDNPVIGKVRCASLTGYDRWSSTTNWIEIGPFQSHSPAGSPWCPNGSFITQIDLDAASASPHDSPVIGRVKCSYPASDPGTNLSPQQRELLDAHNRYRQEVGVPLLRWSNSLANSAQLWAEQVANRHQDGSRITRSDHSSGGGENIWQGPLGGYSLTAMVDLWGSEKRNFRNGIFDLLESGSAISTTGNWVNVAHYTQIVWRNTQEVGCGLAKTSHHDFLVCRYNPPGNVPGQRVY